MNFRESRGQDRQDFQDGSCFPGYEFAVAKYFPFDCLDPLPDDSYFFLNSSTRAIEASSVS